MWELFRVCKPCLLARTLITVSQLTSGSSTCPKRTGSLAALLQPTSGGNLLSQRMRWYPVLQYTRPDVVWTRQTHTVHDTADPAEAVPGLCYCEWHPLRHAIISVKTAAVPWQYLYSLQLILPNCVHMSLALNAALCRCLVRSHSPSEFWQALTHLQRSHTPWKTQQYTTL